MQSSKLIILATLAVLNASEPLVEVNELETLKARQRSLIELRAGAIVNIRFATEAASAEIYNRYLDLFIQESDTAINQQIEKIHADGEVQWETVIKVVINHKHEEAGTIDSQEHSLDLVGALRTHNYAIDRAINGLRIGSLEKAITKAASLQRTAQIALARYNQQLLEIEQTLTAVTGSCNELESR